jgi:hypothetical protein
MDIVFKRAGLERAQQPEFDGIIATGNVGARRIDFFFFF